MPVTQPVSEMIAATRLLINQVSVHEAAELQRLDAAILIDLCDLRELQKMGVVPRAFHAPRGMLKFRADPDCPYHKPVFQTDKKLVLFCASGLRSVLAAAPYRIWAWTASSTWRTASPNGRCRTCRWII